MRANGIDILMAPRETEASWGGCHRRRNVPPPSPGQRRLTTRRQSRQHEALPDNRRHRAAAGTYFLTVNLLERNSRSLPEETNVRRDAERTVHTRAPFHIDVSVVFGLQLRSLLPSAPAKCGGKQPWSLPWLW